MNTNKEYFGEWKKRTQIITLKGLYAQKFNSSSSFRNRICGSFGNPLEQLELHYFFPQIDLQLPLFTRFANGISGIYFTYGEVSNISCCPKMGKLYCLRKSGDRTIVAARSLQIIEEAHFDNVDLLDYHSLSHLKSVSVISMNSITDVSCFKNVNKLSFRLCNGTTDVSCLGEIQELKFLCCNEITDVSSLGRVFNLSLHGRNNVRDVSALGNVHILKLRLCRQVTDISSLRNVSMLHLEDFLGSGLSSLANI
jgi:hypothetical protein